MYFEARHKPAGKAGVDAPALTALERFVNVKLQDRYYGEDVSGVRFVFCQSRDEASRIAPKFVHRIAVEVAGRVPSGADPANVGIMPAFLAALPALVRTSRRVVDRKVDFDLTQLVADLSQLTAPSRPSRWLAPEPETVRARRALARDRWLRRNPRPLVQPLRGVRIYDHSGRSGRLTWWDLGEIVSIALRREGVRTPGYSEIYVNLDTTLAAVRNRMLDADWAEAAAGVLSIRRGAAPHAALLDATEKAVLSRAAIDHLDRRAIQRAFAVVRATKAMEITCLERVDRIRNISARLVLTPVGDGHQVRPRLEIVDHRTGAAATHVLRATDGPSSPYLFHALAFRGQHVALIARDGMRARAARGGTPRVQRFALP